MSFAYDRHVDVLGTHATLQKIRQRNSMQRHSYAMDKKRTP